MPVPTKSQLLLDLGTVAPPTLASFVAGRNGELLTLLGTLFTPPDLLTVRGIHLWGESGAGKTHLARAATSGKDALYLDCRAAEAVLPGWQPRLRIYALDNVEDASPEMQAAIFGLINEVRQEKSATIITTANAPARGLSLREDLRTRLGWDLVFQVHALNDDEKEGALALHAKALGVELPLEVRAYLMTHCSRDMTSLMRLLETLDRYALTRHRGLTIPLVREWMQESSVTENAS